MDAHRFDVLARLAARPHSRRRAFAALLGAVVLSRQRGALAGAGCCMCADHAGCMDVGDESGCASLCGSNAPTFSPGTVCNPKAKSCEPLFAGGPSTSAADAITCGSVWKWSHWAGRRHARSCQR